MCSSGTILVPKEEEEEEDQSVGRYVSLTGAVLCLGNVYTRILSAYWQII